MTTPASLLSSDRLDAIRDYLQTQGNIAVLHWHLYGARAPTPLAFDDFEAFCDYVRDVARPGDAIDVWPFPSDDDGRIAEGKIPEADGTVHRGGAY